MIDPPENENGCALTRESFEGHTDSCGDRRGESEAVTRASGSRSRLFREAGSDRCIEPANPANAQIANRKRGMKPPARRSGQERRGQYVTFLFGQDSNASAGKTMTIGRIPAGGGAMQTNFAVEPDSSSITSSRTGRKRRVRGGHEVGGRLFRRGQISIKTAATWSWTAALRCEDRMRKDPGRYRPDRPNMRYGNRLFARNVTPGE